MVQAHPEAPKNERVKQVTLFCFWLSEQILVINIDYFKGDIMGYQSPNGILSDDVMKENSEQFEKPFHLDENNSLSLKAPTQ